MNSSRTIFVTGATGNQGGAAVKHLLKNGFHVKALTRNALSAKALQLKEQNVEIVQGNLDDPSSYSHHLRDAYGIFGLVVFDKGTRKEIQQALAMADAAKGKNVQHFIYSSVIGCDQQTGIPHWESKFIIENYIRQLGLPYTIIRPASLYENFLIPQVRSRLLKGKLVYPVKESVVQQFISCGDIGRISTMAFMHPEKYLGKTLTIAAQQMNGTEVADIFAKTWNKKIKYQQLPGIIVRLAMGKDLYTMFKWINNNDAVFVKDLEGFRKEYPGMMSLEDWIRDHFK